MAATSSFSFGRLSCDHLFYARLFYGRLFYGLLSFYRLCGHPFCRPSFHLFSPSSSWFFCRDRCLISCRHRSICSRSPKRDVRLPRRSCHVPCNLLQCAPLAAFVCLYIFSSIRAHVRFSHGVNKLARFASKSCAGRTCRYARITSGLRPCLPRYYLLLRQSARRCYVFVSGRRSLSYPFPSSLTRTTSCSRQCTQPAGRSPFS